MATYIINNSYGTDKFYINYGDFNSYYNNGTTMTSGTPPNTYDYLGLGMGQAFTQAFYSYGTKGGGGYSIDYLQIGHATRYFNMPTMAESEIITSASLKVLANVFTSNISPSVSFFALVLPNTSTSINPLNSASAYPITASGTVTTALNTTTISNSDLVTYANQYKNKQFVLSLITKNNYNGVFTNPTINGQGDATLPPGVTLYLTTTTNQRGVGTVFIPSGPESPQDSASFEGPALPGASARQVNLLVNDFGQLLPRIRSSSAILYNLSVANKVYGFDFSNLSPTASDTIVSVLITKGFSSSVDQITSASLISGSTSWISAASSISILPAVSSSNIMTAQVFYKKYDGSSTASYVFLFSGASSNMQWHSYHLALTNTASISATITNDIFGATAYSSLNTQLGSLGQMTAMNFGGTAYISPDVNGLIYTVPNNKTLFSSSAYLGGISTEFNITKNNSLGTFTQYTGAYYPSRINIMNIALNATGTSTNNQYENNKSITNQTRTYSVATNSAASNVFSWSNYYGSSRKPLTVNAASLINNTSLVSSDHYVAGYAYKYTGNMYSYSFSGAGKRSDTQLSWSASTVSPHPIFGLLFGASYTTLVSQPYSLSPTASSGSRLYLPKSPSGSQFIVYTVSSSNSYGSRSMTIYDLESVVLKPSITINGFDAIYGTISNLVSGMAFDINFNNNSYLGGLAAPAQQNPEMWIGITYGFYTSNVGFNYISKYPIKNTFSDGYTMYGVTTPTTYSGFNGNVIRGTNPKLMSSDYALTTGGNMAAFGRNTFVSMWTYNNNNTGPGSIWSSSINNDGTLSNYNNPTTLHISYNGTSYGKHSNRLGYSGSYFWVTAPIAEIFYGGASNVHYIYTSSNGFNWLTASFAATNNYPNTFYTKYDEFSNIIFFNNKYYFILGNKMYSSSNMFYNGNASVAWGTGSTITSPSSKVLMPGDNDGILVTSGASVLFMPTSGSTLNIFRTSDMVNWTDITPNLPKSASAFNIPSYGLVGYNLKYSQSWGAFFLYHDIYSHLSNTASVPNYFYSTNQGASWTQVTIPPPSAYPTLSTYYSFVVSD